MISVFSSPIAAALNVYSSPCGWSFELPSGWTKVPEASSNPLSKYRPELFCSESDWSLSITWTRIRVSSHEAMREFTKLVATPGTLPIAEIDRVVSQLVPLVGHTTKAEAVRLSSGHCAAEIIKLSSQPKDLPHRFGVEFLVDPGLDNTYIDKFSFYADATLFPNLLPMVKESLRTVRLSGARSVQSA